MNTRRQAGILPKVKPAIWPALGASFEGSNTGLNGSFAIGATLVKRQSSWCKVGKPNSANRAMPALRRGKTQGGFFASFSNRSNFSRYGPFACMFAASIVLPIVHFPSNLRCLWPVVCGAACGDVHSLVKLVLSAMRSGGADDPL